MPFQLNKATVSLKQNDIENLIREAVEKEGYKAEKILFSYFNGQRDSSCLSATVEVVFSKPNIFQDNTDYKDK